MSDATPPQQPKFQVHLSTAIWVNLVVALMIGLNLVPYNLPYKQLSGTRSRGVARLAQRCTGWPFPFKIECEGVTSYSPENVALNVLLTIILGVLIVAIKRYIVRRRKPQP